MKQSILIAPQQSRVEERPIPATGPEDVLVRVKICGVCASELHGWHGDGERYPRAYGHEVVGEVVEVGRRVAHIRPGMIVTGLFMKGFAEYAAVHERSVIPVPEGIDAASALGEPLMCIMSGARRTKVDLGDTVAVVGLGFMGLLMLQAVGLKGPVKLTGIDLRQEVLDAALRLGADEVFIPEDVPEDYKLTKWKDFGTGWGVNVVVEASGTQPGLTLAGQMVKAHGILSILGYHQGGPRQVDMKLWNWKALEVLNAHERRPDYQMDCMRRGLGLLAAGKIDMASLITHRYGLEDVDAAFHTLLNKPPGFIKAIIVVGD